MSNTTALQKILQLRMEDKNRALLEQKKAMEHFEDVAQKLYNILKTKEKAESKLNEYVKSEIIAKIREQTLYIDLLQKQINSLQREVQLARDNMEHKRQIVTEKHVELKKIEKMIELRKERKKKEAQLLEMKQMDEISLNRFIRAE